MILHVILRGRAHPPIIVVDTEGAILGRESQSCAALQLRCWADHSGRGSSGRIRVVPQSASSLQKVVLVYVYSEWCVLKQSSGIHSEHISSCPIAIRSLCSDTKRAVNARNRQRLVSPRERSLIACRVGCSTLLRVSVSFRTVIISSLHHKERVLRSLRVQYLHCVRFWALARVEFAVHRAQMHRFLVETVMGRRCNRRQVA